MPSDDDYDDDDDNDNEDNYVNFNESGCTARTPRSVIQSDSSHPGHLKMWAHQPLCEHGNMEGKVGNMRIVI